MDWLINDAVKCVQFNVSSPVCLKEKALDVHADWLGVWKYPFHIAMVILDNFSVKGDLKTKVIK